MNEKIYEKGTLGWFREQQKKKLDKKNKVIERWKRCGIANIFRNKGFNDEDRDDWSQFWSKVDIKDNINEYWNWTAYIEESNGNGYVKGIDRISAHHLSYILTKGSIPDKLQVQHFCNNRLCCNPNHLELGSQSKNVQYTIKCNRQAKGENNGGTILTEDQVREIHKLHKEHHVLKQWQIAEIFKIGQSQVHNIINGKKWKHIYEEFNN